VVSGVLVILAGAVLILFMEIARKNEGYVRRTAAAATRYTVRRQTGGYPDDAASLAGLTRVMMRAGSAFGVLLVVLGIIAIVRELAG
jgi:hypothetical protein